MTFLAIRQNQQSLKKPTKSSTWRCWAQVAHIVIHSFGAQVKKLLSIMYLACIFEVKSIFGAGALAGPPTP
jgi:hypothetical protein